LGSEGKLSAPPDYDFRHSPVVLNQSFGAHMRLEGRQFPDGISVIPPNEDRENLIWVSGIQIDESWFAPAAGCGVFTCYDPADSGVFAVVGLGLRGSERLSLSDNCPKQEPYSCLGAQIVSLGT
jgi:hypothetical protein